MNPDRTLHEALASHGCHTLECAQYGCRVVMHGEQEIGVMTAGQAWIFVRTMEMGEDQ